MAFIEIQNYSKKIHNNSVLDNINLSLNQGKIYGLVGKNGSGKTMLIRAICGLISPSSGSVTVNDIQVGNGIYPDSVGLVIEHVLLFEYMSAFKNLKMLNDISQNTATDDEIRRWLKKFGLNPYDKRAIKKYSLGMCQKVSLIQAFINRPNLIILDEPTNALDEGTVASLKKIIKETNKNSKTTFIIASHDKETINDICDEIIEMRGGKIVKK